MYDIEFAYIERSTVAGAYISASISVVLSFLIGIHIQPVSIRKLPDAFSAYNCNVDF